MEVQHEQRTTSPSAQSAQAKAPEKDATARPARLRAYAPPVDIFETQDAIVIQVDVPGVAKEDVTLRVEKNELSVQATRRESREGPFAYQRAFNLPQDVDGDGIVADLAKGVLTLTLPRKASAKPRTIPIR